MFAFRVPSINLFRDNPIFEFSFLFTFRATTIAVSTFIACEFRSMPTKSVVSFLLFVFFRHKSKRITHAAHVRLLPHISTDGLTYLRHYVASFVLFQRNEENNWIGPISDVYLSLLGMWNVLRPSIFCLRAKSKERKIFSANLFYFISRFFCCRRRLQRYWMSVANE